MAQWLGVVVLARNLFGSYTKVVSRQLTKSHFWGFSVFWLPWTHVYVLVSAHAHIKMK